jgi:hypothetical protein
LYDPQERKQSEQIFKNNLKAIEKQFFSALDSDLIEMEIP